MTMTRYAEFVVYVIPGASVLWLAGVAINAGRNRLFGR